MPSAVPEQIEIPAGLATLGRHTGFGWDNEFAEHTEHLQTRAAFYFQRIMLPEPDNFDFESEKTLAKG